MGLALFKTLEIYDHKRPAIWAKLSNAGVGQQPLAIDLRKLGDNELGALESIEEFLLQGKGRDFPYPLYVIVSDPRIESFVHLVDAPERLPRFFKQKNRPLNIKENNMLAKVNLKQKSLESINIEDFRPVAKAYAEKHKIIHKKQLYLDYLNEVLSELRGKA